MQEDVIIRRNWQKKTNKTKQNKTKNKNNNNKTMLQAK